MGLIKILKPLPTFLKPEPLINFSNIEINFQELQELNPGLLGEKQDLCAMQPPSVIQFFCVRDNKTTQLLERITVGRKKFRRRQKLGQETKLEKEQNVAS